MFTPHPSLVASETSEQAVSSNSSNQSVTVTVITISWLLCAERLLCARPRRLFNPIDQDYHMIYYPNGTLPRVKGCLDRGAPPLQVSAGMLPPLTPS